MANISARAEVRNVIATKFQPGLTGQKYHGSHRLDCFRYPSISFARLRKFIT